MQERSHNARILAAGWLAACVGAVALGQALRLGPAETAYAWPLPGPADWLPSLLMPLALVLVALTAVLLLLGAAFARAHGLQKPWARLLLIHPLLLAFIWLVWPATGRQVWTGIGSITLLMAAAGMAVVMVLGLRRGMAVFGPRPRWRDFRRDIIFLAIIVGIGLAAGQTVSGGTLLSAAILYPLFALVQMTVMLVLPAGDLRRCGLSRGWIAVSCAFVFGLLHWPNPVVAGASAVAMFFWTRDRLDGRGLVSLALGMGLLGAGFSQMLPDPWTAHMRVGPGYVRRVAREDLAAGRLWFIAGNPDWAHHAPLPADFLQTLYPGVIGRPLNGPELAVWKTALDRARRKTVIWQFLTCTEYAHQPHLGPPPLPTQMDQVTRKHWHQVVDTLESQTYWDNHGGNWPEYLAGLYEDILGRKASPQEIATWTPRLNLIQRRQILEVLLGHAFQWRDRGPTMIQTSRLVAPQVPLLVDKY